LRIEIENLNTKKNEGFVKSTHALPRLELESNEKCDRTVAQVRGGMQKLYESCRCERGAAESTSLARIRCCRAVEQQSDTANMEAEQE
jgi:hypothetical protein